MNKKLKIGLIAGGIILLVILAARKEIEKVAPDLPTLPPTIDEMIPALPDILEPPVVEPEVPEVPPEPELAEEFEGSFYAVNGWFGDLPFIGYGMNNLQEMVTGERPAYSRHSEGRIERLIIAQHNAGTLKRPLVLVGHSLGGNVVTRIAQALDEEDIDIDYLAVVDAPRPVEIPDNVLVVDNFVCTKPGCVGKDLNRGEKFTYEDVRHIPLGNDERLHKRIYEQMKVKYPEEKRKETPIAEG